MREKVNSINFQLSIGENIFTFSTHEYSKGNYVFVALEDFENKPTYHYIKKKYIYN